MHCSKKIVLFSYVAEFSSLFTKRSAQRKQKRKAMPSRERNSKKQVKLIYYNIFHINFSQLLHKGNKRNSIRPRRSRALARHRHMRCVCRGRCGAAWAWAGLTFFCRENAGAAAALQAKCPSFPSGRHKKRKRGSPLFPSIRFSCGVVSSFGKSPEGRAGRMLPPRPCKASGSRLASLPPRGEKQVRESR